MHEPWAPSAGSVALRHSRALNVGSFHAPAERVLSTQVARKFVELFFGRMDARTASYEATADLLKRFFPASYELLPPGVTAETRVEKPDGRAGADRVRRPRGARRAAALPARAAACCRRSSRGRRSSTRRPARSRRCARACATACRSSTTRTSRSTGADIVVAASLGQVTAPGVLVRALGAGAVPLAARVPVYEEVLRDGDLGAFFQVGDVDVLASQLERLIREDDLRTSLGEHGAAAREELAWSKVADQVEAIYERLAALRHDRDPKPEVRARVARNKLIEVDLHMHTDHSNDCATPVDVLLATARDVGLGAIAVTDHNEISGAHDAAAKAAEYGIKVIVGEEVKTADQGEVIGLFINEKIPRGMTLEETIADIRRQGGLVYVPHPFDRLHSVPDYEHMLAIVSDIDAIEVFNPRIAIPAFNEEAVRFASKYRIVGGAGTDAHVAQGLGAVRIRMRDFDGPEEFLESLRDADIAAKPSSLRYAQVQALEVPPDEGPSIRLARRLEEAQGGPSGRGARRAVSCRVEGNPASG